MRVSATSGAPLIQNSPRARRGIPIIRRRARRVSAGPGPAVGTKTSPHRTTRDHRHTLNVELVRLRTMFAFGTLIWTSGANVGRRAEILMHEKSSAVAVLTLLEAPRASQASRRPQRGTCTAIGGRAWRTRGRGWPPPVQAIRRKGRDARRDCPVARSLPGAADSNARVYGMRGLS